MTKARVTHFRAGNHTACHRWLDIRRVLWTEDASDEVTCDRCTKTKVWKDAVRKVIPV